MRPKLWGGADAVGEAAARGNALIDTPYQTHSGEGFRADKKPGINEVFLSEPEKVIGGEVASWISFSSAMRDGKVHVVGASDPRFTFRRLLTTNSSTSFWLSSNPVLFPDGKGKGYFFTYAPFSPPYAYVTMNLLDRFGRSVVPQYELALWLYSIEFSVGFPSPPSSGEMFHINGAECHMRIENSSYMDGSVERNRLMLTASIKSDEEWEHYELVSPELTGYVDVGFARMRGLTPEKMVVTFCQNPNEHPSVFYGHPLGGSWSKAPNNLAAAFPNEVIREPDFNMPYWLSEAAYAAAHPEISDPWMIRKFFLNQIPYRFRVRSRGSLTEVYALDSDHILYRTGLYPCSSDGELLGASVSVVKVSSGEVLRTLHRQFDYRSAPGIALHVTMLGKYSWAVEHVTQEDFSPTTYPEIAEALVTFDCGVTYANFNPPPGYVPQTLNVMRAVEGENNGVPHGFVVTCQVVEGGGRRIYYSRDMVTFTRGGLLANAALVDSSADFITVKKLGTRRNPGRINHVAPWANDTRVRPPDWW